jgi:hypothetical protein
LALALSDARDIAGGALAIIILVAALFASIFGPELSRKANFGFGPEWDCVNPGKISGLFCIKHPAKPGNSN